MKKIILIVLAIIPLCLMAQRKSRDTYKPAPGEQVQTSQDENTNIKSTKKSTSGNASENGKKIFTGFSGGMMIHGGYSFSNTPNDS